MCCIGVLHWCAARSDHFLVLVISHGLVTFEKVFLEYKDAEISGLKPQSSPCIGELSSTNAAVFAKSEGI